MKQIAIVLVLAGGLAGCGVTMASQRHVTPSGQVWETLWSHSVDGYQKITCPIDNHRVVTGKCFASAGNSVVHDMLTALSGSVLPAAGSIFVKNGHTFNVGAYAGAEANADVNVKVKK